MTVHHVLKQAWTISGVLINMLNAGMVLGYSTSLLSALSDPDSTIQADLDTRSWLASSVGAASAPGIIITSVLMDIYGRRKAQILAILPGLVGWLTLYFATGVPTLVIGRILTGFSCGANSCVGAVVVGEYSSPTHRGTFLNLKTASVCMGGMLLHIIGHFLTWRVIALICLIPNIVSLSIVYTWPESPAWLASKQQFERAKDAFLWLRGDDSQSLREIDELIKSQMDKKSSSKTFNENIKDFCRKFTRKDFLKPTFIILTGGLLIDVSGRHLFPTYALDIMIGITGDKSQSFYYTVAIDLIITLSSTVSSYLVRIVKRRTLLLSSGLSSVIVLAGACTYLFLASRGIVSNDHTWIPVSLFVVYFIAVNLGCIPVPISFFGELLPLEHRGAGFMFTGAIMPLCGNAVLQVTPFLMLNLKVYGTFAIYGACMMALLLILYFVQPETKDRTLQDIEYYFNNDRFDDGVNAEDEVKLKMLASSNCNAEELHDEK